MSPVPARRRRPRVVGPLILALALAGCTSEPGGSDPSSSPAASASGSSTGASPTTPASGTGATGTSTPSSSTTDAGPPPVVGSVSPVVTYSGFDATTGQIQASAYVDGVQQSGAATDAGTCVLTVTAPDGTTSTGSNPATPDAATTQCGTVTVTPSPLTPGTWSGVLSYSSATAAGSSPSFTVEVTP